MILRYFFFLCPLFVCAQVQIGSDITGVSANDRYGREVNLSDDGQIMAVLGYDDFDNGSVTVHQYANGDWQLYGSLQDGSHFETESPIGIALAGNGQVLAIAQDNEVQVLENDEGVWMAKGPAISYPNTATGTLDFGDLISLSSDGTVIAIIKPGYISSRINFTVPPPPGTMNTKIFAFQFNGTTWNPMGTPLEIGTYGGNENGSLDMTPDGKTMVISVKQKAAIYQFSEGNWLLKGQQLDIIDGDITRVSLSSKGDVVAVGNSNYSGDNHQQGLVKVYQFENGLWVTKGQPISGSAAANLMGISVDIANNGNTLAVGQQQTGTSALGRTRVFNFVSGAWRQIGTDLMGEANGDGFGTSLSLGGNGTTLAVGAPNSNSNAGKVKVYDLNGVLSTTDLNRAAISLHPNPANAKVILELPVTAVNARLNISNLLGQEVLTTQLRSKQFQLEVSNWPVGMYVLKVSSDAGVWVKKLVVE